MVARGARRQAQEVVPTAEPEEERQLALRDELERLRERCLQADEEVAVLRRRLSEGPGRVQSLEERLLETKGQLAQAVSQNEKLTYTLQQAKEHIAALREEVDKLTQPPSAYGTFLHANDDGTVDVFSGGRKMRVAVHPEIDGVELRRGQEVVLNESLNVILAREGEDSGEVVTLKDLLEDGRRAIVYARADEERVVELSHDLLGVHLRAGDAVLMETRSGCSWRSCPGPRSRSSCSRRCPTSPTPTWAASTARSRTSPTPSSFPICTGRCSRSTSCPRPKGILLYGPPGCGKTLIAKAVANSLAKKVAQVTGNANIRSYFLNIKGPELLNKYVGETERQIRLVFQRAREKAEEGVPVIVFFDEMDSLFRTRGTGISSDMESTIVPQLLAEIDGVEALRDVIVIGASNREDLIDPAILRPGRLDVKIKIERPDEEAAAQIFSRYLTADLPIDAKEVERLGGGDAAKSVQAMIEDTVVEMYRADAPPPLTISAGMIASVSGILILSVVPSPGRLWTSMRAADLLDVGLDHVHADAAAGDVGDLLGRGEPGQEDQVQPARARVMRAACSAVISPLATALALTRSRSMPPPSSVISMLTWPPS